MLLREQPYHRINLVKELFELKELRLVRGFAHFLCDFVSKVLKLFLWRRQPAHCILLTVFNFFN